MAHIIKTIDVDGKPKEVFIFEPKVEGPHPGLVQFMYIPVRHTRIENDEFTLKIAERYRDKAMLWLFHLSSTGGLNQRELK